MSKYLLIIFTVFLLDISTYAGEHIFNPVTTVNTSTLERGKFALSRGALGNLNSDFLTSSLNFGLFNRFEIGTAPLFYSFKEHKENYNFKVLVYDGDITTWSLGGGRLVFETEIDDNGEVENPDIVMSAIQLSVNIHIPDSRFKVGLSATSSCGQIKSKNTLVRVFSINCEDETGFDLQYAYEDNIWFTVGQGRFRESGITPYESIVNGYGAAVTVLSKDQFISRPSFGYYLSENGENMFLLTTTFYEN